MWKPYLEIILGRADGNYIVLYLEAYDVLCSIRPVVVIENGAVSAIWSQVTKTR